MCCKVKDFGLVACEHGFFGGLPAPGMGTIPALGYVDAFPLANGNGANRHAED